MSGLSVVIPCYNEEGSIGPFLRELAAQARLFSRFEIIVVDDASRDGSAAVIRSLAAELPLRVITHPRNIGLGAAVRTGFNAATLDWLTYLPGDGHVPAEEVHKFLPYMAAYDLIITRAAARPSSTAYRRRALTIYTTWSRRRLASVSATSMGRKHGGDHSGSASPAGPIVPSRLPSSWSAAGRPSH